MLSFAWEPLAALLDDGLPKLVEEHWQEVGVHKQQMLLAVDWERYRTLERQQVLQVLAARKDDALIGYASFFYLPSLHYQTTAYAACDAIYVLKSKRSTGAGQKLIDIAGKHFAERARPGWCRVTYHDRHGIELLGPALRKRGYIPTDTIYSKMVRD